ncbi:hypothetical protein [Roseobacter weihaiensis]|uniref:hypothetical protein n=1 Tax=Roseobacter weihaiensis TaxID=2763262 RepID=UPI001D0B64A6|nr:hypothetical protein [Roseobacter sp. H9]
MAMLILNSGWTEIVIPANENYRNLKNMDSVGAVTLLFSDTPPVTHPSETWDIYKIAPGERVNILLSGQYRPRVFLRGNNVGIDVINSFTLLGNDPGGGPIVTISPRASGVK